MYIVLMIYFINILILIINYFIYLCINFLFSVLILGFKINNYSSLHYFINITIFLIFTGLIIFLKKNFMRQNFI